MNETVTYKRLSPSSLLRTSISLIGGRTGAGKTRQMWNVIGSKISRNIPVAVFCENGSLEVPSWAYNNPLIHVFGMTSGIPNFSLLDPLNVKFVFVDEVRTGFDIIEGYNYCLLIHSSDRDQSISRLVLLGFDNKILPYILEGSICNHNKKINHWNLCNE